MRIIQIAAIDMTHVKLLKHLNEACLENGMEVHCVSTAGQYVEQIKNQGIYFHHIPIDRQIKPVSNIKTVLSMVKLFKVLKPDIVHVHTPVASVLGRIAAKIAKVPVVIYTAHGFYFHEGMSNREYKKYFIIEKYIGKLFTDYIFTQSEEDYKLAKSKNFLSKNKKNNYLHISNGIDLNNKFNYDKVNHDNILSLKKKLDINDSDIVVSFVGRLVKEKGIIDLLKGFEKIRNKNIKLIVIGDLLDSERDVDTVQHINKYKYNENIIFTGQVTNINEYLYLSDIYCLPSYREGMPRSIIEAMAMKNAIIATNIRGSREEVVANKNGYLVNINSPNEIAKYIESLSLDVTKLKSFKEYGYKRAKKLYDESLVVEKQLKVFKNNKFII